MPPQISKKVVFRVSSIRQEVNIADKRPPGGAQVANKELEYQFTGRDFYRQERRP